MRSAIELKQIFDRLQLAEQSGLPAAELRKLEEQAAEQGVRTVWKVCNRLQPHMTETDVLGCQAGSRERCERDRREGPVGTGSLER